MTWRQGQGSLPFGNPFRMPQGQGCVLRLIYQIEPFVHSVLLLHFPLLVLRFFGSHISRLLLFPCSLVSNTCWLFKPTQSSWFVLITFVTSNRCLPSCQSESDSRSACLPACLPVRSPACIASRHWRTRNNLSNQVQFLLELIILIFFCPSIASLNPVRC
ncbi:hypothetical protein BGZ63DRAFT_128409 [Mariannaea sp. PMI_226]|nr:hypothetical protein BGZ63DRAFT_128409 [Mariannaea sp. PMI_226]